MQTHSKYASPPESDVELLFVYILPCLMVTSLLCLQLQAIEGFVSGEMRCLDNLSSVTDEALLKKVRHLYTPLSSALSQSSRTSKYELRHGQDHSP